MERSGWFDDDDDSSSDPTPEPPPGERPWRHPSELGRFGSYGSTGTRRRTAARLAGAAALGGAGTIVFVALASMHVFGTDGTGRATTAGLAPGGSPLRVLTPSSISVIATRPPTTTAPPVDTRALAVTTTQQPVASMPPRVGVRVGGAAATIPAVIDDEGWLMARADELGGATEADAVLDDGRLVHLTVDAVDARSGVARLKPSEHIDPPADQTMAWMGVTCEDAVPTAAPAATSSTTSAAAGAGPSAANATATAPSSTRAPAAQAARSTSSLAASSSSSPSIPTSALSGTSGTPITAAAVGPSAGGAQAGAVGASASTTAAAPLPTAPPPATTSGRDARVVSTAPLPSTTVADPTAPGTSDPTTPTTASQAAGVRVQIVHDGGPASQAGLRHGDLIVALDGRTMLNRWALVLAVRHHGVGETVHVTVERDGRLLTFAVVLAAGPTR